MSIKARDHHQGERPGVFHHSAGSRGAPVRAGRAHSPGLPPPTGAASQIATAPGDIPPAPSLIRRRLTFPLRSY